MEGLEQLSMGRLASAVGISKAGLYAHFDSKEELQLATISHFLEVFDTEVLHDASGEPSTRLDTLLERWLAFFERRVFPGGCFLIVAAVEFAGRRGPVRDALEDALDQEIAVLEAAIRRANKSGELRATRDARQTAFELHSILINAHAIFQVKADHAVFKRARTAFRERLE